MLRWMRVAGWFVVLGAAFEWIAVALLAWSDPPGFASGVRGGAITWYALLFPALALAGGLALLGRSKWSTLWLALHLVACVSYAASRPRLLQPSGIAFFALEAGIVVFCAWLWRTRRLS